MTDFSSQDLKKIEELKNSLMTQCISIAGTMCIHEITDQGTINDELIKILGHLSTVVTCINEKKEYEKKDIEFACEGLKTYIEKYEKHENEDFSSSCSDLKVIYTELTQIFNKDKDTKKAICMAGKNCKNPLLKHQQNYLHLEICSNGDECNQTDADHFTKFLHIS